MASTKAYPDGGTFLDTMKRSFADVPVDKEKDNAISTTEFLEAAESLTTMFGIFSESECIVERLLIAYRCARFHGFQTSKE